MRARKIILTATLLAGLLPPFIGANRPAGAATFTVTRTNDPNPNGCRPRDCSLREAVIAANNRSGPDIIRLPRGRYELTRPGPDEDGAQSGDLDVLKNTTITGAGPGKTIIDANRNDRIFHFSTHVDEGKVSELAIVRGRVVVDEAQEQGGGGILNLGRITLANVLIKANKGAQDAHGGGVWNEGRILLRNSRITENSTPGDGIGGGIYNQLARLTVRNSRIDHNVSTGESGGGVANTIDSETLLVRSSVDHNRLESPGCCGGGVYNASGSTFEAANSIINFNRNTGCCGGGIFTEDSNSKVVLRHSVLANNLNEGCCAGGVMGQEGTIILRDTRIARNVSEGCCAGGVMGQLSAEIKLVNSGLVSNKSLGCCGGGLMLQSSSTAQLVNSRVISNRVPNGCCGGGLMTQGGTLTLNRTNVRDNKQIFGSGGSGGGITLQTSGLALELKNSTVAGNSTTGDGGGIHVSNSAFADIANSTISGNMASGDGGGIHEESTGEIYFLHVTLTNNEADGTGGGISSDGGAWPVVRSIVARNFPNDCNGVIAVPAGKNLDEDGTCFATPEAIHLPPRLRPLANYGGKTPTHEPRASSPAVDEVPSADCPPPDRDQRGVTRPRNGDGAPGSRCDLGAVEKKP